jgi:hypothetical protein
MKLRNKTGKWTFLAGFTIIGFYKPWLQPKMQLKSMESFDEESCKSQTDVMAFGIFSHTWRE